MIRCKSAKKCGDRGRRTFVTFDFLTAVSAAVCALFGTVRLLLTGNLFWLLVIATILAATTLIRTLKAHRGVQGRSPSSTEEAAEEPGGATRHKRLLG